MQDEIRRAVDTIPGLVWSALPDGQVDFLNLSWVRPLRPPPGTIVQ